MKWDDAGGSFEEAPVGTQAAICVSVIDLGTQETDFKGKKSDAHKCMITWETPNAKMTGEGREGVPFLLTKFYRASLNEKSNLRADLRNWRGRDFTPEELKGFESRSILGKPCYLSITPDDKGRSKITGIMKLPSGMSMPAAHHKLVFFSLEKADFDINVYNGLSEGIKALIAKSPEFAIVTRVGRPVGAQQQPQQGPQFPTVTPDDDDPFNDAGGPSNSTFSQLDDDIPF